MNRMCLGNLGAGYRGSTCTDTYESRVCHQEKGVVMSDIVRQNISFSALEHVHILACCARFM